MHSPVLSVCIPTYNSSSWLAETLDSLVCQFTEGDIFEQVEIIISDNASPDNTRDVVQAYQVKYSNIHYQRNDTNLGGAVNVVKVTETAHGEYLWLLTDNDSATKFSLSYVLRIIHETHFDVMLGNYRVGDIGFLQSFHEEYKGYEVFKGIGEFGEFLSRKQDMPLHDFGSNFSLYSIFFAKKDYFYQSRTLLDSEKLKTHFFPHSMIVFSQIRDKVIVKPHNIFTVPLGHPSSWRHSIKLYRDFREVFYTFANFPEITVGFQRKIAAFLRGYAIITYIMILIGPFPWIGNGLKFLMTKSKFITSLINKILHPGI